MRDGGIKFKSELLLALLQEKVNRLKDMEQRPAPAAEEDRRSSPLPRLNTSDRHLVGGMGMQTGGSAGNMDLMAGAAQVAERSRSNTTLDRLPGLLTSEEADDAGEEGSSNDYDVFHGWSSPVLSSSSHLSTGCTIKN